MAYQPTPEAVSEVVKEQLSNEVAEEAIYSISGTDRCNYREGISIQVRIQPGSITAMDWRSVRLALEDKYGGTVVMEDEDDRSGWTYGFSVPAAKVPDYEPAPISGQSFSVQLQAATEEDARRLVGDAPVNAVQNYSYSIRTVKLNNVRGISADGTNLRISWAQKNTEVTDVRGSITRVNF